MKWTSSFYGIFVYLHLEIIALSHWFGNATFLLDHNQTRLRKSGYPGTQRLTGTTWGGTTKGPMENHRIFCFIPSGENPECASLLGRMGGCKLNEHTTAYASSAVEPLRGYNKRSDGFPSEFLFYIIMELKHREHYNRVGKSKGGTNLVPPFLQMIENHFLCRGTRITNTVLLHLFNYRITL